MARPAFGLSEPTHSPSALRYSSHVAVKLRVGAFAANHRPCLVGPMAIAPRPPSVPVPPFVTLGPIPPQRPVILSVPHAGRHYPQSLLDAARVPWAVLQRLEDRHVDQLSNAAVAAGFTVVVAQFARALIDLNRGEEEWDGQQVHDALPPASPNQRVRAGLGLVPVRLHPYGELWRGRLNQVELERRLSEVHRPYHSQVADLLAAARRQFGGAVLLDLHSMPTQAGGEPHCVLGDRYGLTASAELADALLALAQGAGLIATRNSPYAGAHGIERHSNPSQGVEAVQVEFDRALYLDATGEAERHGCDGMARLVARMAHTAESHLFAQRGLPLAAE